MLKQFFLSHLSFLYKLLRLNILVVVVVVVVVCCSVEVSMIIVVVVVCCSAEVSMIIVVVVVCCSVEVSMIIVVVSSKKRFESISLINQNNSILFTTRICC